MPRAPPVLWDRSSGQREIAILEELRLEDGLHRRGQAASSGVARAGGASRLVVSTVQHLAARAVAKFTPRQGFINQHLEKKE
jgi:hypothetical protein